MIIVSSSDNAYAQHLGVMIISLLKNKARTTMISIYILDGGISEQNRIKLLSISKKYSFMMAFIKIDPHEYKYVKISDYISQASYYRILIPNFIPHEVNKILYLDCDIIVKKDLSDMWNTDISNYYLAAVENQYPTDYKSLGLLKSDDYFNAGVMLVNIESWRNMNVTRQCFEFLKKYPEAIRFWDQDVLNAVIKGLWYHLPSTYNFESSRITFKHSKPNQKTPHIIHFFDKHHRPWLFITTGNKMEYWRYLWRSPWRFYIPPDFT